MQQNKRNGNFLFNITRSYTQTPSTSSQLTSVNIRSSPPFYYEWTKHKPNRPDPSGDAMIPKADRLWNVILDCWSVGRCHDSQNQPLAVRSSKPASPSTSPSGPNKPEALQYVQANLPLHRPVQVVQTNLKWLTNTQFPSTHKIAKVQSRQEFT